MKTKTLSIAIPAHNEGRNLESCIYSLNKEVKNLDYEVITYICLNGCSDNTSKIAELCSRKYPLLNIQLLGSAQGKLFAQEKIINSINSTKLPILFIDADITLGKNSIKILIEELMKHKRLIAVGAFPKAKRYRGINIWKRLLDNILNIRSRHPLCEISKLNVEEYHPYVTIDFQYVNTSPQHEIKSKIFFHGRMFILRSKIFWARPDISKPIAGDDSFLPDYIISNYGKDRIRIRYNAIVYYLPFISLYKHFKVYRRIYFDLKNLERYYPKFRNIRNHSKLIIDNSYIKTCDFPTRIYFRLFKFIRIIERLVFKLSKETNPKKLW